MRHRYYTDVEKDLPADFAEANKDRIQQMDCMTCHNRNSHEFKSPDQAIDDAMSRGVISPEIPYFKQNAMAIMEREYPTMDHASNAIMGLKQYYTVNWPDYYSANQELVDKAIGEVDAMYKKMVYPDMEINWTHASRQCWAQEFARLLPLPRRQAFERAGGERPRRVQPLPFDSDEGAARRQHRLYGTQ